MPAISTGTILITGATGYIGAWIVKSAVDRGYSVVVAVRNDEAGLFVTNRFPEYKGKVTYVLVPDISKEGAYDEAVKGVDAIIHAASPVKFSWNDPDEVVGPAVKGATGILQSALKYGQNVKRVVFTSSVTAVHPADYSDPSLAPGTVIEESRWNKDALEATLDKNSTPFLVYSASKARAEKAAHEFFAQNKPPFDLVVTLPTWGFGPYIHKVIPGKPMSSSPSAFLATFASPDTSGKLISDWFDVRDSALLHVLALENEALSGQRFAHTNGTYSWQDLYDIANEAGYDAPGKETKGAGATKQNTRVSNARTFQYFPDFKYRSVELAVKEMADQMYADGFLKKATT